MYNLKGITTTIIEAPSLVDKLIKQLLKEGYIVVESPIRFMGIPQSITIIRNFTGPFATHFSMKLKEDFDAVSRAIGIEKLFR